MHCDTTSIHHATVKPGHAAESKAADVAKSRAEILILHGIYPSVFDVAEEAVQVVIPTLARALHRVVLVCLRHAVVDWTITRCSCSCWLTVIVAAIT